MNWIHCCTSAKDGFKEEFLKNDRWYAIRISSAMIDRIRYIAVYPVAPFLVLHILQKSIELKKIRIRINILYILNLELQKKLIKWRWENIKDFVRKD